MLRFKEYLEEGKLSIANLEKRKDGVKRGDIVHDWIKSNKPVKIDGNDVLLTYIDPSLFILLAIHNFIFGLIYFLTIVLSGC